MDVLGGTGVFVLLTAKLKTLVSRARVNDRPRVHSGTTLENDLSLLWNRYKDRYCGAADFTYRTDRDRAVKEEAEEIIDRLKKKKLL
jgi:shikimate kinase